MIDELDRVDGLRHRQRALEQAQLMAFAWHDPAKLGQVARELDRSQRPVTVVPERVQEQAQAVTDLVAYAERIERRQKRKKGQHGTGGT